MILFGRTIYKVVILFERMKCKFMDFVWGNDMYFPNKS